MNIDQANKIINETSGEGEVYGNCLHRLFEAIEVLQDELAACAAGPWHDASEEPPKEGMYLCSYISKDLGERVFFSGYWNGKTWPSGRCPHWAELREPKGQVNA